MKMQTRIMARPSVGMGFIRYSVTCRPLVVRDLSRTLNKSAVTDSLISVLKDELKYEREYYRKDEVLLEDPPGDFQIDSPPGKNSFYLLKEFEGESIVIEVDLDNQPTRENIDEFEEENDDEDEDGAKTDGEGDDELAIPVRFQVSVSKGGAALIFECESDGELLSITHIAHEPSRPAPRDGEDEDEEDDTPDYTGPVFEDLDDTLQQAFLDYLEDRGVTAELGAYIRSMHVDKEAEEYMAWLTKVKEFVSLK